MALVARTRQFVLRNISGGSRCQNAMDNLPVCDLADWSHGEKLEWDHPFISEVWIYCQPNLSGVLCLCRFDANELDEDFYRYFDITRPQAIRQAVVKRQAEYLAGRILVQHALRLILGDEAASFTVKSGTHGQPDWPKGLIGSISHTNSQATCLVVRSSNSTRQFVGIDIEWYFSAQTYRSIDGIVHDNTELKLLTDYGVNPLEASTLIFSAKESLFKSVFMYVNCYLNFHESRVIRMDHLGKLLVLELASNIAGKFNLPKRYECQFRQTEKSVFTIVFIME